VVLLFAGCIVVLSRANQCTDQCDALYPTGLSIIFCGSDRVTYQTMSDAVSTNECYFSCSVSILYEGSCGCPNDCYSSLGQGICAGSSCSCSGGWGGLDCSLPAAGNPCGYHGKFISSGSKDNELSGLAYCDCDGGWTGTDCSSKELEIGNAPWVDIFDDSAEEYSKEDKYGDDHPIFDISRFSTIQLFVADKDLEYVLFPPNAYNQSYVKADFYYSKGDHREYMGEIGMKSKGAASRQKQKKSWSLKFNEFISGQDLYDMKKVGMKSGAEKYDAFGKNIIYSNLIRAVGGPVARHGFSLLYINGIYNGVYVIHEDIDDTFLQRRLQDDDGMGGMMKLGNSVHMGYYGSDLTYYQEKMNNFFFNETQPFYEASASKGSGKTEEDVLRDFVDFLSLWNSSYSTVAEFEKNVESYLDINLFLKFLMIETFVLDEDHLGYGNNYNIYHRSNNADKDLKDQRIMFYGDFDEMLDFKEYPNYPVWPFLYPESCTADILTYFTVNTHRDSDYDYFNPITTLIFQSEKLVEKYISYYKVFLEGIYGSNSPQQPSYRYSELTQFLYPWVAKDKIWQISFGMTADSFVLLSQQTINALNWRYRNVTAQIAEYERGMEKAIPISKLKI
jgi:hypothetical protein